MINLRSFTSFTVGAFLVFCLNSCSARLESFSSLSNQGIVPLSTSNAYLGANLFLAREAEKSSHLYNFLRFKGGPTALQVTEGSLQRPGMILFYPVEKSVYVGELETRDQYYQWVLRGPYAIDRKDYRNLEEVAGVGSAEPTFVIFGKPQRFIVAQPLPVKVITPNVPPPLPPKPSPAAKRPAEKSVSKKPVALPTSKPEKQTAPFRPLNSDQDAIRKARGLAELAENGDIIHITRRSDETVKLITRWYTGSPSQSADIAAANGLSPDDVVPPGTRVRIAARLVTNERIMSSDFQ